MCSDAEAFVFIKVIEVCCSSAVSCFSWEDPLPPVFPLSHQFDSFSVFLFSCLYLSLSYDLKYYFKRKIGVLRF